MKNKRSITLLLSANIVSGFAQGISMLAIPWYFTGIADKASMFAAIYAISTFVSLFWNLYAGTLIDRFPRKKIFIYVGLVCGAILTGASIAGYLVDGIMLWLAGLVFVTTMFNYNIHFGTLYAFGQELTDPSRYGKISSYLEIQNQATSVLSGTFAAFLMTGIEPGKSMNLVGLNVSFPFSFQKWEMEDIFALNALTYFVAILLVSMIKYRPPARDHIHTGSIFKRLSAGIEYLKKNPSLFAFGNYSYSIFVVLMVQVFMLLPLYVSNHLQRDTDVFASAEIYYSLGAMLAGMFVRRVFANVKIIDSVISLMFLTTAVFLMAAFTKSVAICYLFSFAIGITNAGARVLRTTWLFTHISNDIIGRTNGVFNVINILLRSAFLLLFSIAWFSEGSNVIWSYVICGVFVMLSGLLLLKGRKRIEMTDNPVS